MDGRYYFVSSSDGAKPILNLCKPSAVFTSDFTGAINYLLETKHCDDTNLFKDNNSPNNDLVEVDIYAKGKNHDDEDELVKAYNGLPKIDNFRQNDSNARRLLEDYYEAFFFRMNNLDDNSKSEDLVDATKILKDYLMKKNREYHSKYFSVCIKRHGSLELIVDNIVVILENNWHGLITSNGKFNCVFCSVDFDMSLRKAHIDNDQKHCDLLEESRKRVSALYGPHLIREIPSSAVYHCAICNFIIDKNTNIMPHIQSPLHFKNMNISKDSCSKLRQHLRRNKNSRRSAVNNKVKPVS